MLNISNRFDHHQKIRRSKLADDCIINHRWWMSIRGAKDWNVILLALCWHKLTYGLLYRHQQVHYEKSFGDGFKAIEMYKKLF